MREGGPIQLELVLGKLYPVCELVEMITICHFMAMHNWLHM